MKIMMKYQFEKQVEAEMEIQIMFIFNYSLFTDITSTWLVSTIFFRST